MELVPAVLDGLRAAGLDDVPVVVGGIIPESDGRALLERGVAAVYTPKDFGLTEIMGGIVGRIRKAPIGSLRLTRSLALAGSTSESEARLRSGSSPACLATV